MALDTAERPSGRRRSHAAGAAAEGQAQRSQREGLAVRVGRRRSQIHTRTHDIQVDSRGWHGSGGGFGRILSVPLQT